MPTTAGALVLEPPLRPRELTLEADPVLLREQGVRDVVLEVRYPAGDIERSAHATVKPSDEIGRQTLVQQLAPRRLDAQFAVMQHPVGIARQEPLHRIAHQREANEPNGK